MNLQIAFSPILFTISSPRMKLNYDPEHTVYNKAIRHWIYAVIKKQIKLKWLLLKSLHLQNIYTLIQWSWIDCMIVWLLLFWDILMHDTLILSGYPIILGFGNSDQLTMLLSDIPGDGLVYSLHYTQ